MTTPWTLCPWCNPPRMSGYSCPAQRAPGVALAVFGRRAAVKWLCGSKPMVPFWGRCQVWFVVGAWFTQIPKERRLPHLEALHFTMRGLQLGLISADLLHHALAAKQSEVGSSSLSLSLSLFVSFEIFVRRGSPTCTIISSSTDSAAFQCLLRPSGGISILSDSKKTIRTPKKKPPSDSKIRYQLPKNTIFSQKAAGALANELDMEEETRLLPTALGASVGTVPAEPRAQPPPQARELFEIQIG